jgi:hypothetical protein
VKPGDFRNKKREYLKDKINELATNSKNKNIRDLYRGIIGFKKGHQPRNNLVKDENGDLLVDSHNILNRWKNNFSQLLKVHNASDIRQKYIRLNHQDLARVVLKWKLLLKS